jgi:hypothetical protein
MEQSSSAPPQDSLPDIAQDLLNTTFFTRIVQWFDSPRFGAAQYAIDGKLVDLSLTIAENVELKLHQIVLGSFSSLFVDLFLFHGGTGDLVAFNFHFPFPTLLTRLIQFFYVLTNPEIRDLSAFLTDTHFGDFRCHVLLICTLSFLGECNLLPRVQNSLREFWNPAREPEGLNPIGHIFGEIQNAFAPGLDVAQCVHIAFARMNGMMKNL